MNDLLYQYRWPALTILLGLILTGTGLALSRTSFFSSPQVEILNSEVNSESSQNIYIEVAGSVVNPGVFELDENSRVDDALTKAGGLSDTADLDWVERTINRAAKLTDGQKIYIPSHSETESANNSGGSYGTSDALGTSTVSTININTASSKDLESLWGIGPVTAQNIIDNRPYSNVEELLVKKIIKSNVYETNKDKLSVY